MGCLFTQGKIEIILEGDRWLVPGQEIIGFINVKTDGLFQANKFSFSLIGFEHMQWEETKGN